MALTREELLRQFGALAKQQQQKKVVPQVSKPVVKPTWTEAKAPVTAESQARDLALAQRVVSTTPGAFGYGVARGVSMPVTATAKLLGYQESPEEAAVRTLAESKRLTAQMDASKGMGAPNIIQGRSVSPEMVGRVVGSVLPFSAAESAVGRVLPTLAGQGIKQTALRGAVAGGALQGLEEAGQGKRGMELAGSVALGTALGAGADIGLGYLAKAIRGIRAGQKAADVVADIAQNAPQTKVTIEQELGLPEGSSWLDIQRKMEEDEAVEALYQKYETTQPKPAPEPPKKPFSGNDQYGVPEGKTYEQFAYEQEQARLAEDYLRQLEEGASAADVARNIYPGKPFSGNEQYGIPEGMDYATYQRKSDEERVVDEYYRMLEQNPEVAPAPQPPRVVPSLKAQTPTATTARIADVGVPQGVVPQAGAMPTRPQAPVPPPRIPVMPDIERELFPQTMRQPTPGPTLPEPAIITAQRRAQEALRPMAPDPQVITPQVKPEPSAAIPERMAVDSKIGVASKPVPERIAQEAPEIGVGTLDVKAGIQPGQKQSKLYTNTIPNSEMFTPQELENLQIEFEGGYTPKANAETLANAKTRIAQNGADAELEALKQKDTFNSDDFVTSMEILKDKVLREARETGDYSKVTEMLELIRKSGSTEAGRVVQAHQIYSRTPEGMLALAKKVVDNVNAKGGKATLTPDDIRNIDDSMRRFQDLPPGRDKDAELSKVKQIIADKVPSTFIEKYRSLQRILWLLNPQTLITRNPLGNVILQGAEGIKNIPATGLDYLISLKTGKRTTTMAGGYLEGAKKGLKEQLLDIKQGVDTAPTGGQAEIPRGKVWDSAELEGVNKQIVDTLDKLDNRVGQLLKLGDRPFYEGAYNSRINQLKKLNKTDEVTEAMAEDARLYALERTLQKDSELAKTFQRIKTASDNPAYQVFANTLLPFTKTPANILDKMFEYSPGGFIKAATQIGKKGDAFDQKYFVDNVSRALTGTGLMALGYIGAKNGFITGKPDKDKEVAAVERLIGRLPYAFVTDGGSYTFDWAQPVSALLAIGADAYYGGKDKETFAEQLSGSAEAAGNTFFNLGMLQGITRVFGGYSPIVGLIKSITEGVSGLSTPAITSQTAKTIDPYVRETDKQLSKKILAKTPGASFLLEPKLDLYGRPIKQSEGRGVAARALENFLSPGFYATGSQSTPGLKEAYRVYKATGEKDIFPRLAPETITVKGDVKKLTPELKVEFQKDMGAANLKSIETLIKSSAYKSATDDDKAKMLNDLIKDNREATKKKLMPKIEKLP